MAVLSISNRSNEMLIYTFIILSSILLILCMTGPWNIIWFIVFLGIVGVMYHSVISTVFLFVFGDIAYRYLSQFYRSYFGIPFGSVNFTPVDVVTFAAIIVIMIRFAKSGLSLWLKDNLFFLIFIFIALITIGIIRGLGTYKYSAIGDARYDIWFTTFTLYLGTSRLSKKQILNLYKVIIFFLCYFTIIGVLRVLGIVPIEYLFYTDKKKIIYYMEALLSIYMFFSLVIIQINSKKWKSIILVISVILLFANIMFLFRTIWFAGIVGMFVIFVIFRHINRYYFYIFLSIILIILFIFIGYMIFPKQYSNQLYMLSYTLNEIFQLSESDRNSVAGRILSWKAFLIQINTISSWIFGKGYGDNFQIEIRKGELKTGTPHSLYIALLREHGFLGLIIFLLFVFKLQKRIFAIRQETQDEFIYISTSVLFVCIAASLGFMIGYGLEIYNGIPYGIALSLAFQWRQKQYTDGSKLKGTLNFE